MEKYLFKNGRLIDPSQSLNASADILVVDGVITEVGTLDAENGTKIIDLAGLTIIPGGVDLHVHLRAMKESYKETIATGTHAARKGGITHILAMPNTQPRLDSAKHIDEYKKLIELSAKVEVKIAGAITEGLKGKVIADLKSYPNDVKFITDDGFDIDDTEVMKAAMYGATEFDLTVMVHPEIHNIASKGVINEGIISEELGVIGQPNEKEYKAVEKAIKLQVETGCKLHLTHLTTADSVQLVREAKQNTNLITCDVTPHHIALTEEVVRTHLGMAKVNPPLRTENDRLALIHGIKDGTVDFIVSDHAPHALKEKMTDLKKAAFGFSGLEIIVPATITELHLNQGIDLMKVIALLTTAPAKVGGIEHVDLKVGSPANFVAIDLDKEKEVDGQQFVSLGKVTAFDGKKLKGWPVLTTLNGKIFEY